MPELPEVSLVVSFQDFLGQVAGKLGQQKAGCLKVYYWVEIDNERVAYAGIT